MADEGNNFRKIDFIIKLKLMINELRRRKTLLTISVFSELNKLN